MTCIDTISATEECLKTLHNSSLLAEQRISLAKQLLLDDDVIIFTKKQVLLNWILYAMQKDEKFKASQEAWELMAALLKDAQVNRMQRARMAKALEDAFCMGLPVFHVFLLLARYCDHVEEDVLMKLCALFLRDEMNAPAVNEILREKLRPCSDRKVFDLFIKYFPTCHIMMMLDDGVLCKILFDPVRLDAYECYGSMVVEKFMENAPAEKSLFSLMAEEMSKRGDLMIEFMSRFCDLYLQNRKEDARSSSKSIQFNFVMFLISFVADAFGDKEKSIKCVSKLLHCLEKSRIYVASNTPAGEDSKKRLQVAFDHMKRFNEKKDSFLFLPFLQLDYRIINDNFDYILGLINNEAELNVSFMIQFISKVFKTRDSIKFCRTLNNSAVSMLDNRLLQKFSQEVRSLLGAQVVDLLQVFLSLMRTELVNLLFELFVCNISRFPSSIENSIIEFLESSWDSISSNIKLSSMLRCKELFVNHAHEFRSSHPLKMVELCKHHKIENELDLSVEINSICDDEFLLFLPEVLSYDRINEEEKSKKFIEIMKKGGKNAEILDKILENSLLFEFPFIEKMLISLEKKHMTPNVIQSLMKFPSSILSESLLSTCLIVRSKMKECIDDLLKHICSRSLSLLEIEKLLIICSDNSSLFPFVARSSNPGNLNLFTKYLLSLDNCEFLEYLAILAKQIEPAKCQLDENVMKKIETCIEINDSVSWLFITKAFDLHEDFMSSLKVRCFQNWKQTPSKESLQLLVEIIKTCSIDVPFDQLMFLLFNSFELDALSIDILQLFNDDKMICFVEFLENSIQNYHVFGTENQAFTIFLCKLLKMMSEQQTKLKIFKDFCMKMSCLPLNYELLSIIIDMVHVICVKRKELFKLSDCRAVLMLLLEQHQNTHCIHILSILVRRHFKSMSGMFDLFFQLCMKIIGTQLNHVTLDRLCRLFEDLKPHKKALKYSVVYLVCDFFLFSHSKCMKELKVPFYECMYRLFDLCDKKELDYLACFLHGNNEKLAFKNCFNEYNASFKFKGKI